MNSFGADEDDRESGGSPDGSSDNDQDGIMADRDDADVEADGELDADIEGDGENDEENDDEDEDQDQVESQDSFGDAPNRGSNKPIVTSRTSLQSNTSGSANISNGFGGPIVAPTSHPNPSVLLTSPSSTQGSSACNGLSYELPKLRPEVLTASVYDIVPTIAAPHSTSINSITATPDLRWIFSGGADGYIRKFNWVETANGKALLTVAQRHPFVDSVTKAGVLISYWENYEDPSVKSSDDGPSLSSVYSLAVQHESLWLLSGLESGGINLQSVRHDEGKRITCLKGHTSAVSALNLSQDEKSVLSGSWDKTVVDWDLNTGKSIRSFEGSGGQISALESRPPSGIPVPEVSGDVAVASSTFSADNADKPRVNGTNTSITHTGAKTDPESAENFVNGHAASPADSLFGGNDADSLFGDNDNGTVEAEAPSGGNFVDDEDDEFSRAIADGIREQEQEQEQTNQDAEGDVDMSEAIQTSGAPQLNGNFEAHSQLMSGPQEPHSRAESSDPTLPHKLSHAEELTPLEDPLLALPEPTSTADSIFLAASFDGSLRVWDKRQPSAVANMTPRNVPPWCMNACWSPDGNFIYAGRRNGTVDEYSLHKGLRGAERSFKLPNNSGPVSAVRAMPNGRHLICASYDILRLYDLQQQQIFKHATVPFLIVPGHRTGVISQLYIDPTCRYLMSTAGNRGWEGANTEVLLGYEIGVPK